MGVETPVEMEGLIEYDKKYFYTKSKKMDIMKVTGEWSIIMEEVISNDSTEKRCDGFTGTYAGR